MGKKMKTTREINYVFILRVRINLEKSCLR